MSWLDKIETPLTITCGDGKKYEMLWKPTADSVAYNVAQFNYPNVAGTQVKRGQPKGRVFRGEFYIQGADHLDVAATFKTSADDSRVWTIEHPFYGMIKVQPVGLTFDRSSLNQTKITGQLMETIGKVYPSASQDISDSISETTTVTLAQLNVSYSIEVVPDASDVNDLKEKTRKLFNLGQRILESKAAQEYFNLFNEANRKIDAAVTQPLSAITAMQAFIQKPAAFSASVRTRANMLKGQFENLGQSLSNIVTPNQKRGYENNAGGLIVALCTAASTPDSDDLRNRTEILDIINILLEVYDNYLINLDSLQTVTSATPTSYQPDADSMQNLNELVNYTAGNLFGLTENARQLRTIVLDKDSNVITLAHRLYGLEPDDSTIEELIEQNNWGWRQIIGIEKGTPISYYI